MPCVNCGKSKKIMAKGKCNSCYQTDWNRANPERSYRKPEIVEKRNQRVAKGRDAVLAAKSKPCADCGHVFPPYVMDFDHVRGVKCFNLSNAAARTLPTILKEIDKCDVVCANCHRIRTHERGQHLVGLAAANAAIQLRIESEGDLAHARRI